uniref:Uncharacterized protein n=1 Tax=Trichogramma kaykai TaxID=54128 RepID=A0ABD2VX08_9HYME
MLYQSRQTLGYDSIYTFKNKLNTCEYSPPLLAKHLVYEKSGSRYTREKCQILEYSLYVLSMTRIRTQTNF